MVFQHYSFVSMEGLVLARHIFAKNSVSMTDPSSSIGISIGMVYEVVLARFALYVVWSMSYWMALCLQRREEVLSESKLGTL